MARKSTTKPRHSLTDILRTSAQPSVLLASCGALAVDEPAKYRVKITAGSFSKTFDGTLHFYNGAVGDFLDPVIWKDAQLPEDGVFAVTGSVQYRGSWHDVPMTLYEGEPAEYSYLSVVASFHGELAIDGQLIAMIALQLQICYPG